MLNYISILAIYLSIYLSIKTCTFLPLLLLPLTFTINSNIIPCEIPPPLPVWGKYFNYSQYLPPAPGMLGLSKLRHFNKYPASHKNNLFAKKSSVFSGPRAPVFRNEAEL